MIGSPPQGVGSIGAGGGARDPVLTPPPASTRASTDSTYTPAPRAAVSGLATAAAVQGSLAPLLSDLEAALGASDIPAAVRVAAEQVLDFGLDADTSPSDADLQALLGRSGLFLEAQLAAGIGPAGDFRGMLLNLAEALTSWAEDGPASSIPSARKTPPPPFGGGPVRGQGIAPASIGAGTAPDAIGARLLAETQAALARQTLMQSASTTASTKGEADSSFATRWLFELPLAEPNGRSVAQFEIARDGRRQGEAEAPPTWRTRFSLDVEGLGPVHAAMALTGERLHVALWAETPATETMLSDSQRQLLDALQGDGLSAEVVVRAGAPAVTPPPAGRFMDTAA